MEDLTMGEVTSSACATEPIPDESLYAVTLLHAPYHGDGWVITL